MGRRKLRIGERTGLARIQVLLSAGRDDGAGVAALELLEFLEWDRLDIATASFECEIYHHPEAVPGYVLCDGTGRCLTTRTDYIAVRKMIESDVFGRFVELDRGLWPLGLMLMHGLEDILRMVEGLGAPSDGDRS